MKQKRIRDWGLIPGRMLTGSRNAITDVPGVKVGHSTIHSGDNHTGVTVILPGSDNAFSNKYTAAAYVHNGFGKSAGLMQVQELGTLETPIALTNTLNVGVVWDAVCQFVLDECQRDGVTARSLNPVVGECNDSRINNIAHRAVTASHVTEAFEAASEDFEQGSVGAGTGTICYGFKGGIGSASRQLEFDGKSYTIGVLVQSNFGATTDFVLDGKPAGQRVLAHQAEMEGSEQDKGSIMTIVATDLPLSHRQLYRVIRRAGVGIARTGAYTGHGSGEVMIGFTTANRISEEGEGAFLSQTILQEHLLNTAFLAAAEAAHEAILDSMVCAEGAMSLDNKYFPSLSEYLPWLLEEN